jgi:hypothetical protein
MDAPQSQQNALVPMTVLLNAVEEEIIDSRFADGAKGGQARNFASSAKFARSPRFARPQTREPRAGISEVPGFDTGVFTTSNASSVGVSWK